ncbi:MAG: DNA polymerase III subunit [Pirellulales bacterium]
MTWQGIEGHDDVIERFRLAISRNRLASTFLFVGPAGIGKRAFAEKLAQALLCPHVDEKTLVPCGRCDSCVQVGSHTHPDLVIIEKPPDKSFIPLAAFVGDDQRRMREGLCHDIALKPFMGGRKVAIIDDADYLNEESANCLLKTLEEPPPLSVLILIGTTAEQQLATIRSRAQTIRFHPLAPKAVAAILLARGLASDRREAERLAEFSEGSVRRAVELSDDELWSFRRELLAALGSARFDSVALAGQLASFVEAAGKDAGSRRARARQIVGFTVDFYRQVLRRLCTLAPEGDAELVRAAEKAAADWPFGALAAAAAIDRSLEVLAHIDRNAYLPTLLECWLDDLARIVESGQPVPNYAAS